MTVRQVINQLLNCQSLDVPFHVGYGGYPTADVCSVEDYGNRAVVRISEETHIGDVLDSSLRTWMPNIEKIKQPIQWT